MMGTDDGHMADRLRHLELLTGGLARRTAEPEEIPENGPPAQLVPVPRRARVFLRHGEGHGTFAELTLTAPKVRS